MKNKKIKNITEITRYLHVQLYANQLENLDQMRNFQGKYALCDICSQRQNIQTEKNLQCRKMGKIALLYNSTGYQIFYKGDTQILNFFYSNGTKLFEEQRKSLSCHLNKKIQEYIKSIIHYGQVGFILEMLG